ncbi:hypothetical protein [Haloplanus natans]|uniref:hypothetical protein n=1 Tax=Haloplanus natans TaxID=376171 RepID=UPI00067828D1|nr:hypothetical protein [Haloplanus natans]
MSFDERHKGEISNHIEHFRMSHSLDYDDLAIMVDPVYLKGDRTEQYLPQDEYWEVTIYASNKEWLQDTEKGEHQDRVVQYTFEETGKEEFLEEVYPDIVETFEEKYRDRVGRLLLPDEPEYSL